MAITQLGYWQGVAGFDRVRSGAIIRSGDRTSGSEQHWRACIENDSLIKAKSSNRCLFSMAGDYFTFTGAQLSGGPLLVYEGPIRTSVAANGDLLIVYAGTYTQSGASTADGKIRIQLDDGSSTSNQDLTISGSVSITSTTWTPAATPWAADTNLILRVYVDHNSGTSDASDTLQIDNLAVLEDELTAGELPT